MKPLDDERIARIRAEFPMLRKTPLMQGKRFCYLDTAATALKPDCVIAAQDSYYQTWTANTHRGDYDLGHEADVRYQRARQTVADFIGAASADEISFTSGCTEAINRVAQGLFSWIQPGDEIITDRAEHASNILPWFRLARLRGAKVVFADLDERGSLTPEAVRRVLTPKTKILAFARITNVLGSVNDARALCALAREAGILSLVDAAQSVACETTRVEEIGCDFLCFSGHKMYGPTGIGVLYGRRQALELLDPPTVGGGMNARFYPSGDYTLEDLPLRFEAGTQNIAGAAGLAQACRFVEEIGADAIGAWERRLKQLARARIEDAPGVRVLNPDSPTGILTFIVDGVPAQDEGTLLNSKGICVRSGLHCAKILPLVPKTGTVRASFGVYSDRHDAEQLAEAIVKGGDILDAYFA